MNWTIGCDAYDKSVIMIFDREHNEPVSFIKKGPRQKANARLVAAVPKMLESLRSIEEIAGLINARQHAGAPLRREDWAELYHCTNKARAVIAEATGGEFR